MRLIGPQLPRIPRVWHVTVRSAARHGPACAPSSSRAPSLRRPCPNSGGDTSRPSPSQATHVDKAAEGTRHGQATHTNTTAPDRVRPSPPPPVTPAEMFL
eukprot:318026-Prymnesium_polylepis.1